MFFLKVSKIGIKTSGSLERELNVFPAEYDFQDIMEPDVLRKVKPRTAFVGN